MNAKLKPDIKAELRGKPCPVCKTELILFECEVDAGKCVDCLADEAHFLQLKCGVRRETLDEQIDELASSARSAEDLITLARLRGQRGMEGAS